MSGKNENNEFSYTYSAKEQEEIRKIREKYTKEPECESKMERLRRLDSGVTHMAMAVALTVGVVGALLLGLGMSLIMTELGEMLGLEGGASMLAGVIVGIFGGAVTAIAYPVYSFALKKGRKRVSAEVLSLAEELIK